MAGSIVRLRAAVAAAVGCRRFASLSSACLMLPSNKMYSLSERKVVNIKSSEWDWDQVVGSSHGWVGLLKESSLCVWNPMSGDHIELPPIPINPGIGAVKKLIVDDAECSRVVIVGSGAWLGVCCPGRCSEWTLFSRDGESDDVVTCSQSQRTFYTLNNNGELVRWNIGEPRRPRMEWKSSLSELGYRHGEENPYSRKSDWDICYSSPPQLVYAEHSDQLFIVTRHYLSHTGRDGCAGVRGPKYSDEMLPYMTSTFDVHLVDLEKGKARYLKRSLDGLVMFVGLNDSFAVPAADFPHLKPDSVYYTDHHARLELLPSLDQDLLYGGHDVAIYDYKTDDSNNVSSIYYPIYHHGFKRNQNPTPF